MVRALESPVTDPTYLEFFGLTRPPFARLSQPSQIFHTEQYSLLMAHLAAATEHSDCLVVICGADGSGKTTLLNHYISGLGDDISYATIDETCKGEKEFYCAFLRQLGFNDITGTPRELRRITKEFLVHRGMAGDPVLMMIDNAHLVHPKVLEQLRLISAIKAKNHRVLSVVLAGNSDLVQIMDSPAMSQIKFHSHVHFNIRVYTREETANYVCHHLKMAGATDAVNFSKTAHPLIYRYTGGIPNLINVLCTDLLTEAYAMESHIIKDDLVRTVADKQRLLPHVVPLQGKGRRKTDPDFKLVQSERQAEERITARDSTSKGPVEKPTVGPETTDDDSDNLLEHIAQLSAQFGELRAHRMRALQDIGTRDKDISELRKKLDAQTAETEKLASALGDNTDEIGRLKQALSDSTEALQKSEKAAKKLAADLKKEKSAAKTTQADFAKAEATAKATAKELSHLNAELQAAVSDLTADLKLAAERVVEIDVLEKNTADLKDEIKKKSGDLLTLQGELDARDKALADLEKLLQESQKECASLQLRAATLKTLEESVAEKDSRIADLKAELASYSQAIMALEAENTEVESRGMKLPQADDISALEAELQESKQMFTETQPLLSEDSTVIAQLKTKEPKSPKSKAPKAPELEVPASLEPENQPAADSTAPEPDSAAGRSGTIIAAFEVVKDGKIEQVLEVAESQPRIMIGRSEDSELRLNSEFVSRHHALIFCTEERIYIEDLNSFNGTIVNSKKITRCDLQAGDVVTIGDFQILSRQL